jgi:hypothetical protein
MLKEQTTGEQKIRNAAAYFTFLIRFRAKRKERLKNKIPKKGISNVPKEVG